MKYVLVVGGSVSGLGKGITASSIAVLLKASSWNVTMLKIDPYLNMDAGTMSPYEHGETFTLDDGGETDLDLGNYERFLDVRLTRDNNITTGKIYQNVINAERAGKYLGKTVQVIPHNSNEIINWIERTALVPVSANGSENDFCVIELGGTVGDIESMPFIEALRQLQYKVGHENFVTALVTYVPILGGSSEQKTKPTQNTVKDLRAAGLFPSVVCCRCSSPIEDSTRRKLAMFCQVQPECIMSLHDIPNIHGVPLLLNQQGITQALASHLGMYVSKSGPNIQKWSDIVHAIENPTASVTIAVCGKYTEGTDTYLSVIRALQHAAASLKLKLDIAWVDSEQLEDAKQGSVECVRQRDTAVLQWLQTLLTLFACTKRIGISFALAMAFSCPEALVPVESMV
jgi:CTP synthase